MFSRVMESFPLHLHRAMKPALPSQQCCRYRWKKGASRHPLSAPPEGGGKLSPAQQPGVEDSCLNAAFVLVNGTGADKESNSSGGW